MKKFLAACALALAVLVFTSFPAQAGDLKIGVFDIQRLMAESKTIEGYRQKLGKEIEAKRKVFAGKQEEVKQLEEKLKKAEDKRQLEEKFSYELRELKRLKEDIDLDIQRMDRELTQTALKDIGGIIRDLAKKDGYTIIFEKSAAGIANYAESVDITKKIISLYDAKR
ncbi:MAG TPA: OmpH family outer membrane protein [Dissulfurispiraceae bacterium]